jgi:hypothetical protein
MSEETPSHIPTEAPRYQEMHPVVPEETSTRPGRATGSRLALIVLLVLAVCAVGYSFHERNLAKKLAANNSAISTTLDATRDQLNALTAKVSDLGAKPSPQTETPLPAHLYRKPLTAAVVRHRIDDPRWKKMQGQLDDQGQQIESTRHDLASTRTELQGSIARTHDDLLLLQKEGERNYYEFDLDKTGRFERQGPISLRLRKANTKHDYADLELLVDDSKVSKKHVNVYEPVVFYPADEKLPVEIVINSISKNHIHGYVSEPKYRTADLQAMANSAANNQGTPVTGDQASSNSKPSPVRQRLQLPADVPAR